MDWLSLKAIYSLYSTVQANMECAESARVPLALTVTFMVLSLAQSQFIGKFFLPIFRCFLTCLFVEEKVDKYHTQVTLKWLITGNAIPNQPATLKQYNEIALSNLRNLIKVIVNCNAICIAVDKDPRVKTSCTIRIKAT